VLKVGEKEGRKVECSAMVFRWASSPEIKPVPNFTFKALKETAFLIRCYSVFGMQWLKLSNNKVKQTEFVASCFLQRQCAAAYFDR